MKRILVFLICLFILAAEVLAQPATVSYPFAVGRTGTCGSSGSADIHFYTYNGGSNTIANATGGQVNACVPQLRIGLPVNGTQRFTSSLASVSFNPRDHNIYYLWTTGSGASLRTHAWRWPVGTCPGTAANKLDTIRSFRADILGVAFDQNGNGYILEFTNEPNGVPHKAMIRSINFSTGVMGGADTMNLTGGARIYETGSGDVAMSPSGQMFFVVNNKLFTPNYSAYTGTGSYITCTYIDTVRTSNNFVGLTYAEGETIAAYSGGGCPFEEIVPLTAVNSPIIKNTPTTVKSASDLATVISGVGAAKSLVSVTPTGTANQYNVVYDIVVKNYGNMDVSNLQVSDNLAAINGIGNISNISVTIPVNPNGYTVNPLFTGVGPLAINNNILAGSPVLPNYPVANSTFTIRISCRLSGIMPGTVYYNSATATAVDFNNNNLMDVSTNGNNPDLNGNDKPDDTGESQPTPLLITVPAVTPPCGTLTNILYTQDFGTGTTLAAAMPAPVVATGVVGPIVGTSLYGSSTTQPLPLERYTLTNNAYNADNGHFISMTDHTGNTNGRMLLINADAANTVMYRGSFYYNTCANQQYSLSFYAAFPGNASYQTVCNAFGGFRYPRIRMRIRDGISGLIITETSTTDITNAGWQQYGLRFLAPVSYNQLIIELINDAPGGCGNDVVIDDIQFGNCDPVPTVSASVASGCIGSPATFTAALSDPSALGTVLYQWQSAAAAAGPWTNIPGATGSTYTIASVVPGDIGRYFRVIVASTIGNMASATCRFTSPDIVLTGRAASIAATTATTNKVNVCPGIQVTLGITGGTLGYGASWVWYAGGCGTGTSIGTGASITVNPTVTTTYYVRAEGICNNTICRSVTVFISCNIDKDRDGIPDYVESNIPAALTNAFNTSYAGYKDNNHDYVNDDFQADGDSDADGIPNYLDTNFPGRIDSNSDGVDDRFDMDLDGIINMLDLDSDNDGIPDVVEAGGVDADGDGRIDNFADSDGDGLANSVDANSTGANNSGNGLGAVDLDNDGRPNALDRDSDGDGIPDVIEVFGPDANNDAIIDGFVDTNGDGWHDSYTAANSLLRTGADTNNDGRADSYPNKNFDNDRRANPYDIDSDGDGIVDVIEAGFSDTNYNGFEDGVIGPDGWSNTIRSRPAPLSLLNSDAVGRPNYLDIDSDGDGIPDNIEGQSTAGYRFPTYTDTDNDGLDNAYDLAPHAATFGGAGILLHDRDGDLIPDYIDLDSDSDGQPDIREGHDWNFDGIILEITTPLGTDADGDGLDDRFDLINSTTNLRGTSGYMGTSGSLSGDATPGTRATVQRTLATGGCPFERDWRCVSVVLPVTHFQLNAADNNNIVALNWGVISSLDLTVFEIERSADNINYEKIGTQPADITHGELKQFNSSDNIATLNNELIYYRIKVTGKNGQVKYSNVVVIRRGKITTLFSVTPNPASDVASVRFTAEKEVIVTISIKDFTGKLVHLQKAKALKGNNVLPLNNLTKYSNGVYHVQLLIDNDVQAAKLIIQH
ncbi:MAG: T9SS type A sorting domain-containing protein [Sphingobacteriaceae bacterium]|nr:MAG: T9SS type A sorting domain-containing protein [Sphingobacteriaceae bacterium]